MCVVDIKIGDYIETPRFLKVRITAVFEYVDVARECGFYEPTHYSSDEWVILGKPIVENHMWFAAAKIHK